MVDTLSPAGFAEVRRAEAGQGQGDCQAGPGREEHVWAWLSASACLCASHGASWMRVALARPSGSVLMSGGRGRGAHRGVRYVVHCFDNRGCLGRHEERRDHRRGVFTPWIPPDTRSKYNKVYTRWSTRRLDIHSTDYRKGLLLVTGPYNWYTIGTIPIP